MEQPRDEESHKIFQGVGDLPSSNAYRATTSTSQRGGGGGGSRVAQGMLCLFFTVIGMGVLWVVLKNGDDDSQTTTNLSWPPTPSPTKQKAIFIMETNAPVVSPTISPTAHPSTAQPSTAQPVTLQPSTFIPTVTTVAPTANRTAPPTIDNSTTIAPTRWPSNATLNETATPSVMGNMTQTPTLAPVLNTTLAPTNATVNTTTLTPSSFAIANETLAPTILPESKTLQPTNFTGNLTLV